MSDNEKIEEKTPAGGRILRIVSTIEGQDDNLKNEVLEKISDKFNNLHQEIAITQFETAKAIAQAIQAISWVDRIITILLEKEVITREDLKNAVLNDQMPDDVFLEMQNATLEFDDDLPSPPPAIV